jgi:hypothetical protein
MLEGNDNTVEVMWETVSDVRASEDLFQALKILLSDDLASTPGSLDRPLDTRHELEKPSSSPK